LYGFVCEFKRKNCEKIYPIGSGLNSFEERRRRNATTAEKERNNETKGFEWAPKKPKSERSQQKTKLNPFKVQTRVTDSDKFHQCETGVNSLLGLNSSGNLDLDLGPRPTGGFVEPSSLFK
jgi:hypothetical protein